MMEKWKNWQVIWTNLKLHPYYVKTKNKEAFCREWNSHISSLKPREQLGHGEELGLTYV